MKERKLTILLALLAALALVFAGACSDGSDDVAGADDTTGGSTETEGSGGSDNSAAYADKTF